MAQGGKRRGSIRRGQIITTYGPGSLIDLPRDSAIVGGLDYWPREHELEEVTEPRLTSRLRRLTGGSPPKLYAPPAAPDRPGQHSRGIRSPRFPSWFLVQASSGSSDQRRRRLVHRKALDDRLRFDRQSVVPTRFVRGCRRGHVDDIDWYQFVHGGDDGCRGELHLVERGTGGNLAELFVTCSCGAARGMAEARRLEEKPLGFCDGTRPWLGPWAREDCTETSRLLLRTASNAWFPQIVTALSLPLEQNELAQAVEELWDDLEIVDEAFELKFVKKRPRVSAGLAPFSDEDVLAAIEKKRSGDPDDRPMKQAELEALIRAPEGFGDDKPVDDSFHARRLPSAVWRPAADTNGELLEAVVQVHRLREVAALAGFTRFEPLMPDIHGEYDSDVKAAQIATEPEWFPVAENRGEGIFLLLAGDRVASWRERREVIARARTLEQGHARWCSGRRSERPFPGVSYVLLHTLSHLLIHSLALECGYPAASLRERVYAVEEENRYGLLLYTASPSAEGTLGGLVQQAHRIGNHLRRALDAAALCSNDPVCAQHEADDHVEERWLHGAACHGCVLVAETSCEMRNDYLDRALVAPTMSDHPDSAFFRLPT